MIKEKLELKDRGIIRHIRIEKAKAPDFDAYIAAINEEQKGQDIDMARNKRLLKSKEIQEAQREELIKSSREKIDAIKVKIDEAKKRDAELKKDGEEGLGKGYLQSLNSSLFEAEQAFKKIETAPSFGKEIQDLKAEIKKLEENKKILTQDVININKDKENTEAEALEKAEKEAEAIRKQLKYKTCQYHGQSDKSFEFILIDPEALEGSKND